MGPDAHESGATPSQELLATAFGRNRRLSPASIRLVPPQHIRRRRRMFCSQQRNFLCWAGPRNMFYEWKSRSSVLIRLGRVIKGSITTRCSFPGTHPALHFGLQVLATVFWNDARGRHFPQVGDGKLGKIRKNRGQRRRRLTHGREPHVVGTGPLAMANDGGNHRSRER